MIRGISPVAKISLSMSACSPAGRTIELALDPAANGERPLDLGLCLACGGFSGSFDSSMMVQDLIMRTSSSARIWEVGSILT